MSVTNTTSKVQYTLTTSGQTLSVPFYFLENSHLKVIKVTSAGVKSVLTLTTDYTVSGAGVEVGGSITMVAGASGDVITILRVVPATQSIDYVYNDAFPAATQEKGLDKLTMIFQRALDWLSRCIYFPEEDTTDGEIVKADRKNKLLGFDAAGAPEFHEVGDVIARAGTKGEYATIAALQADNGVTSYAIGQTLQVKGYYAVGDFGEPIEVVVQAAAAGIKSWLLDDGRYANLFAQEVNPYWFGARGNGTAEDVAEVQAAITAAISATLPLVIPDGDFRADGLTVNAALTIFGRGGQIRAFNNDTVILTITGDNFHAERLVIDGNSTSHQGILIDDATDGKLIDCEIRNITQRVGNTTAETAAIYARDGASNWTISNILIEDVEALENGIARGIYWHGRSGTKPKNVHIFGGFIKRITPVTDADGICFQTSSLQTDKEVNSIIQGVTFIDCYKRAVKLQSHNVRILGCSVFTSSGISMVEAFGIQYGRAVIRDCKVIATIAANGTLIRLPDTAQPVAETASEPFIEIENNYLETLASATTIHGIRDGGTYGDLVHRNLSISGNTIKGAYKALWFIQQTIGARIVGNKFLDTGSVGIQLAKEPKQVSVADNLFLANVGAAIRLEKVSLVDPASYRCSFINNHRSDDVSDLISVNGGFINGNPEIWGNSGTVTTVLRQQTKLLSKFLAGLESDADLEVLDYTKGLVLETPDGRRVRVTVDNTPALVLSVIP